MFTLVNLPYVLPFTALNLPPGMPRILRSKMAVKDVLITAINSSIIVLPWKPYRDVVRVFREFLRNGWHFRHKTYIFENEITKILANLQEKRRSFSRGSSLKLK